MRRCANLGRTAQRQRRRTRDSMAAFDALPAPLRAWLSRAALPWSPASACASGSDNGHGGHDRPDPGHPGSAEARALAREVPPNGPLDAESSCRRLRAGTGNGGGNA
ncbi:DUF6525 family protein [Paracoccus marcusii]|uniref:DUF6525 family protein n=1 Tax=Paracoccus marcusii TaxID=59779 RepID=UPI002ED380F6|nr:DUF6525 family protein [Paracoccus marcusii]